MRTLSGVVFNVGEEVTRKLHGQSLGEALDGGIGLLHCGHRGISLDARRDDVARRHLLEVHDIVCRHHTEGPLNAESEGTFEMLDHLTAQGSQATGHRTPVQAPFPLKFLARGHGGALQIHKVLLCR